jgi:hypothetical protein
MNPCASFYELKSGLSFVEMDLPYERGTQDFKFEFSLNDCQNIFQVYDMKDPNNLRLFIFSDS